MSLLQNKKAIIGSVIAAITLSTPPYSANAVAGSLRQQGLEAELHSITQSFNGHVGLCAQAGSSITCVNRDARFSLQSVMKLPVALAVFDAVDTKGWRLDEPVRVRKEDLSAYIQPIAQLVTAQGYQTTIGDLVRRAVVDSDSAAADILIARLGGAAAVQDVLNRKSIAGIRIDRDEKHLQTDILGMPWRPEYVDNALFEQAVKAIPEAQRDAAYRRYQADSRDSATPSAMARLLQWLAEGKLLTPASTGQLLAIMRQTATGPDRLKAGLPPGWTLAHKTGTSSSWKGVTAATNDVGILTAPDGGTVALAGFIGDSAASAPERAALMAKIAGIVTAHYR